jgi:phage-related protein
LESLCNFASQIKKVVATHGFIKKTQKTPAKEIAKAEAIRKEYFNDKKQQKK